MFQFKLDGDADHGWIGEVHDGDTHKIYNPEGGDVKTAVSDMLADHFGEKKAPTKTEAKAAMVDTAPKAIVKPPEPSKPA